MLEHCLLSSTVDGSGGIEKWISTGRNTMSLNGKKLLAAVKRGVADVQRTYRDMQREAEERAKRKVANARTKYEKEKAKAELEREKLVLKREMYEAQAAVVREKEAVANARRSAGILTLGEQVRAQAGSFSREFRALQGTPRKRKASPRVRAAGNVKRRVRKK